MISRRIFCLAATTALFLGGAAATQAETQLNFGHTTAKGSHYSVGVQAFGEKLKELSGGEFVVVEQAAGALGGERDMIEGLQIGSVDLVLTSTGPLGNFVPETLVLDLPFLFKDYDSAHAILDGEIGQELLAKVDEQNLVALAWSENGFRYITNSVRPINTPEDLKGLKIRTMENPIHMEALKDLGASPTPMAFPEVFTALQQHTIDGQENPLPVITTSKFWEVQSYITLTGHFYSPAIILVSPILWESLSDEQKGWFQEAAKASVAATRAKVQDNETNGVALLQSNGMQVVTTVDKAPFIAASAPAYASFTAKYGDEMLKRIQAAQQ